MLVFVLVMEKMFDMTQHMPGYGQGQPMDQRFGPMQQAWSPYPTHTSFSPYHPYPRSFDMFQGNFMDGRCLARCHTHTHTHQNSRVYISGKSPPTRAAICSLILERILLNFKFSLFQDTDSNCSYILRIKQELYCFVTVEKHRTYVNLKTCMNNEFVDKTKHAFKMQILQNKTFSFVRQQGEVATGEKIYTSVMCCFVSFNDNDIQQFTLCKA